MGYFFASGGGGGGGGTPAYAAEVGRPASAFNSNASQTFALSSDVAAGKRLVLAHYKSNDAVAITGVTDSAGNTWSLHGGQINNGGGKVEIASAPIASPLSSGQVVTVTYASGTGMHRGAILITLDNAASVDVDVTPAVVYGVTRTATLTTTAAAVVVGVFCTNNPSATVSSVDGTQVGATYSGGGHPVALVYKNTASAGSQSMTVTLNTTSNFGCYAVAFK